MSSASIATATPTAPGTPRSVPLNASFAFVGDAATKAAALATMVALARLLSTTEMARFGVALAVATILTTVLDAGASTALVRDGAADARRRGKAVLGSALGRLPLLLVVATATLWLGSRLHELPLALIVLVYAVVSAVGLTLYSVFRAAQDLAVEAVAKIALSVATPVAVAVAVTLRGTAAAATLGFALAALAAVVALLRKVRPVAAWDTADPPLQAFVAGFPFALMAVATLAYYRSGTLFLGAWSTHVETASYTLAAAIGFGALAVPNAVTTSLLPRLSAEDDAAARRRIARAALRWTVLLCLLAAALICAFARLGVLPVFGDRYATAAGPLAVLAFSLILVGVSTVIGTVLIAERRVRPVAIQVGLSLALNVAACALLVPPFGALGAAIATLITELFALGFLVVAACEPFTTAPTFDISLPQPALPGAVAGLLSYLRSEAAVLLGRTVVAGTVLLELWAMKTRYGLRVIADTPTYLSLLRELALHPFHSPASPFIAGQVNLAHATPDLQLLAFIWKGLAAAGFVHADLIDLLPAYQLLAIKGLLVTMLLFHALHYWTYRQFGSRRIAWLAVAVLPTVWGPALIVSPGDLSFHGLMSTADHSEALAIALLLYTLVILDAKLTLGRLAGAATATAAVMVTHPFTGVRLASLASVLACYHVFRGEPDRTWKLTPPALLIGFLLASQWPAYNLSEAMQVGRLYGSQIVLALVGAPYAVLGLKTLMRSSGLTLRISTIRFDTPRAALKLACFGLLVAGVVAARELDLYHHPDPWFHTNRWAIYWNGSSIMYWPLLLAPGAAGLAGIVRVARHGRPLPVLWAGGCIAIGLLGAMGLPIPLWHRFLLFAQIPVAVGMAVILAGRDWRAAKRIAAATLVGSTLFAFGTLFRMPQNVTYFGNPLQAGWYLPQLVPHASRTVIASDPASEYFVLPTGDRVLTMTTWHIGGRSELQPARRGYLLMRRLYVGDRWRPAAREMWRLGVRYVVVNRGFMMNAPTLDRFSSFDAPYIVHSWEDQAEVVTYMGRLARIATKVGSIREYHIYRLDHGKLFPR